MQELDQRRATSPYLSGRLLAVLEEIQQASSKGELKTTLVNRFYGTASTAPASVFGNLLKMATTAHVPKAEREGRLPRETESLLWDIAKQIDEAGGFRTTLKQREQADFALGFYAQRAELEKQRQTRINKSKPTQTDTRTGERQ